MRDNNLWKEYVRWHILATFFSGYEEWVKLCRKTGVSAEISEIEYGDYLYGTNADLYIPLWASVCGEEKESLMNGITLQVLQVYRENGYRPTDMQANPPDYIGQQCRFLAYLLSRTMKGENRLEEYLSFIGNFTAPTVRAMECALAEYEKKADSTGIPAEMAEMAELLVQAVGRDGIDPSDERKMWSVWEEGNAWGNDWHAFDTWELQPEPSEAPEERITTQTSFCDCGRKCKMSARVKDGCVLSIGPDTSYKEKRFVGCARGHQYRQTFLTPHRLRYPMIRRGKRGEGLFRRVTWEEAETLIAEKIRETAEKYGPGSRYVMPASGVGAAVRGDRFMKDLLALTGGYLNYYNYYSCPCAEHALPYVYGTDVCGSSEEEMTKTKLLILWGHNPADTIWGDAFLPNLAKAREAGVRIIVIDPRKSATAVQYADQWIGILPSSDGAMADAMAYEILSRGLQDQEFMDRFCIGFDADHMPEGVPKELNYRSYLFGEADGIKKTAEWASGICGVPAETIRTLAVEYATTKPACLMPGLGPQRTLCGEQNCRSFAMLACLTGNTGISGGGSGGYPNKKGHGAPAYILRENPYPAKIPSFLWTKAAEEWQDFTAEDGLKGAEKLECGVKLIFNLASGMLINQHSDVNRTIQILSDSELVDTVVISELFMTPGARYADILLPGVSFFETENIVPPWNASDYILYNEAAIPPIFEGRFEYEWIRKAAEKLGVEKQLSGGRSISEWLNVLYDETRKTEPELPDYKIFQKKGCFVFSNTPYQIAFQEQRENGVRFPTPSGKIEIFSERIYRMNRKELPGIPCYTPCAEGVLDPMRKDYPLLLIGFHTKRRCHSIHDNNRYLDDLESPEVWINPEDARERGILDGDLAEVYNSRGRVRIRARVTERIVKGAVAMTEGGWFIPGKDGTDQRGCINTLTMSRTATPLAKANPQHTNLVQVAASER